MAGETTTGRQIASTRVRAGLSQRTLADKAGMSQATLHRVECGDRTPKMPELVALARALGCSLAEISAYSPVRERMVCFARAENSSAMAGLRRELARFLELDAYLEEQGVPRP